MLPRRAALFLSLLLATVATTNPGSATPPASRAATLARGVNVTNWFRFPARADAAAIGAYVGDAALADLRRAGFTFVRLPFDPGFALTRKGRDLLVAQLRRLHAAGLAVVLVPASTSWRLEDNASDRGELVETWRLLAPALRALSPERLFPEVVNEPVFAGAAATWDGLQEQVLSTIRAGLPRSTIVLDGAQWSSLDGLDALTPLTDPNVIYSVHFYDPAELTSLAAYRPGLDVVALARLPFPQNDTGICERAGIGAPIATREMIGFVCAQHWDAAAIEARIARARRWAERNKAVVLLSEFGASARLNAPARLAWIRTVRVTCERAGIGWALWGYDDVMGFDVARPPGSHPMLDDRLLVALGL